MYDSEILNANEATKFSPFKLVYNRNEILPADNILQTRRIYNEDVDTQIAFQELHISFIRIRYNVPKAKKNQLEYVENKSKK